MSFPKLQTKEPRQAENSNKRGAGAVVENDCMDEDSVAQQEVQRQQDRAQELQLQQLQQQEQARVQAAAQAQALAAGQAPVQQPDIATILQGIQQQLAHLTPMNAQLQVVAQGLEVVTNKVAYMEAKQEDSDYSDSEGEEGEHEELVSEANKFFTREKGLPPAETK